MRSERGELLELYNAMQPSNLYPLWEVLDALVRPEPASPAVSALWHYADIRNYLLRAGELISAEEAERRVLILENPGLPGQAAITPRLYAGLQLVLPGEVASCHRHSQSALRFVMEGAGAYTAIDGEKVYMERFDLILTPNWRWHDHGNPSSDPVVWLDGLDIPLVRSMDGQFSERLGQRQHVETLPSGTMRKIFGRSLRPLTCGASQSEETGESLLHYPFAEWREALDAAAHSLPPDPHVGYALEFLNPGNGRAVMPTMSAHVRFMPAGFCSRARRSTEAAIFTVVEGEGMVEIDGETFLLSQLDIIVIPSWARTRWVASSDLVLFAYSDRVIQEKLCLYRELCE